MAYPPNRWKKSIVELLSKGDILHLSGISDFNLISPQNHTPATLSIQAQVTVASLGWHWDSLWPSHSLVWSVSCPQPAWLLTLSPLDDFEQLDCPPLLVRYPSGNGSATIILSTLPNGLRLRWPSANSSQ